MTLVITFAFVFVMSVTAINKAGLIITRVFEPLSILQIKFEYGVCVTERWGC